MDTGRSWGRVVLVVMVMCVTVCFACLPVTAAPLLKFNGDGGLASGNILRLTPDAPSKGGSIFLSPAFAFGPSASFQSVFRFDIDGVNGSGPLGSDGMTFVVQNDSRGAAALGNGGGDLSYGCSVNNSCPTPPNNAAITPSVAVEFDTHDNSWDPNDNHVAVLLNGDVQQHKVIGNPSFPLNGGERFAWIEYDGSTDHLNVFLADTHVKPATPLLSFNVDINSVIGSQAYFGFTAATGGGFNAHDILDWKLDIDGQNVFTFASVPEPSTLFLLAPSLVGLLGYGWWRQKQAA